MADGSSFFVPIVLSDTEAVAVKSACAAVVASHPAMFSPEHPLMVAALKIEMAWREALDKAEAKPDA